VLTTLWLIPAGARPSGADAVWLCPAGVGWDVVVTPAALGVPVLRRLLACPDDSLLLGPVLCDAGTGDLYWFVARGATDAYPDGARLLSRGSWVGLPMAWDATAVRWLHAPDAQRLTAPSWLAVALWDQIHRTSNPRPGASAMSEPAQPPEPARCQMCTEPPSPTGPVMPIGPGGRSVDMDHPVCFTRARYMATEPDRARVRA
jgi:hypothetical protein